ARPQLRMFVSTTLLLKNINANIATNALRPFLATNNNQLSTLILGTGGSNNGLVITGFQDQVAALVKTIRTLDEGAGKEQQTGDARIAALERRIADLEAHLRGDKKDEKKDEKK